MSGIIDHGIFWHMVTATLSQGGAIIMALAVLARLTLPREWSVRGVNLRLANETMVTLLLAWNLLFTVLAGVTGLWLTWGFQTVSSMSLTLNKSMFGTFALLSLLLSLWIRYRYGSVLWRSRPLTASYAALTFIVAFVAVVNGSLGGEASLLGTILAPVWDLFGVPVRYPMTLPTVGGIVLLGVVVVGTGSAALAAGVLRRRGMLRKRPSQVR